MLIGVPKEVHREERRVAATPDSAEHLQKLGYSVAVETGAGAAAQFTDEAYREAGAEILEEARDLWRKADIVLKVRGPEPHPALGLHESEMLKDNGHLISFIWPAQNEDLMGRLRARNGTILAMDTIPRISRAQKCDALSSMANIAGYRAVVEATNRFGRFFGGQTTAAGNVPPAKIMVIGAGVSGLSAIGAGARMGAIVRAFDTRPEVRQQVESLGAEFLELAFEEDGSGEGGYAKVMSEEFIKAEMDLFAHQAMEVDVIITTALIPGKPAPRLITAGMVESMQDGSIIVDLAAEQGGNCELTVPGDVSVRHGVSIIGYTDLPSRMATQSSQLYANNLWHLLDDLTPEKDGQIFVNMEDDLIRGATVIRNGDVTWPPPAPTVAPIPAPPPSTEEPGEDPPEKGLHDGIKSVITMLIGGSILYGIGLYAPTSFMVHFTIFVLSCFVGWQVIWNVTPALHTPLMSVTNAISGIVIVGPLLMVSNSSTVITVLATAAIVIATINIAGGFVVTQRMLQMFRKS
ncbi:MAG: NAD(P)(+) transhydrogenase (Re/Si-specific) subunit alpha [Alphaproteobacteria bacterium]|nr:NAD(P)(+) transhydrogenase (Re/Si-specific) subunit alpha [Alphaproteobacteria bacterium]